MNLIDPAALIRLSLLIVILSFALAISSSALLDSESLYEEEKSNRHSSQKSTQGLSAELKSTYGLASLCLDSYPDASTVLKNSPDDQELLVIFKGPNFWLKPFSNLSQFGSRSFNESKSLFAANNSLVSQEHWPQFPARPKRAVSFLDIPSTDQFYNNVLIFDSEFRLNRYRVEEMKYSEFNSTVKIELISKHITKFYSHSQLFKISSLFVVARGTRTLLIGATAGGFPKAFVGYVLNQYNLDNPVPVEVSKVTLPNFDDTSLSTLAQYNEFKSNHTVIFTTKGDLCIDSGCLPLRETLSCEGQISSFTSTFAFWLWHETDLTFRLILVTLASILLVNLILASAFVYNQMEQSLNLT